MTSSELQVKRLVVGPITTNCFIVWDDETMEGAIIDPGEEAERILNTVKELGVRIIYILATHCHFDHIAAVAQLKREIDADFLAHEDDLFFVEDGKVSAHKWGFEIEQPPNPDRFIKDGDEIKLGAHTLKVIHLPGHSPGGVGFLSGNMVFAGDTLFQSSIGRTDFRLGSLDVLRSSIRERLYTLPDDTVVHTGHGPSTTIGAEKGSNMFVRPIEIEGGN